MPERDPPVTEVRVPLRVRYVECDPMNVAHHSVYPVWMEMGRTELLRAQGAVYRECEERGVYFVVAKLNIRYRRSIKYDDQIEVHVVGLPCAGVKVEHRYEIFRGEELMATAETTLVCVTDTGKPVPVPEGLLP